MVSDTICLISPTQPVQGILIKRNALPFRFGSKMGVERLGKPKDKFTAVPAFVKREFHYPQER